MIGTKPNLGVLEQQQHTNTRTNPSPRAEKLISHFKEKTGTELRRQIDKESLALGFPTWEFVISLGGF